MTEHSWFTIDPNQSLYYLSNISLLHQWDAYQAAIVEQGVESVRHAEFLQLGTEQFVGRFPGEEQAFYDPASFLIRLNKEYERIKKAFEQGTNLAVILGSGLGYLASHVEEDIRGNLSQGLLIIENRPEWIASQFCLFDCRILLQSKQVYWVIGTPSRDRVQQIFERYRFDLIPQNKIFPCQERILTQSERMELQNIGIEIAKRWKETSQRNFQMQRHFFERMKQPARYSPGRIWSTATPEAYAHTPLIRSLLQGFQSAGWDSCLFEIESRFANHYPIQESLFDFCPDVILMCNTTNDSYFAQEINRPRLVWLLDHPRYYAGDIFSQSLSRLDYVFYIDRFYESELMHTQARICQHIPPVPSILQRGKKREEFLAPILFVGSYQDASPFYGSLPPSCKDELFSLIDYLLQNPTHIGQQALHQVSISEPTFEILRKKSREFTVRIQHRLPDTERQIDYFLYSLANSWKRETSIRALLDSGVVVYGPDSWKTVMGEKYANQYRGWMANEDLAAAYASADIVLNLHSLQCPTCLNPRDFDVLAAGGCLLSDWVEDYDRGYLTADQDCRVAKSTNQLVEITKNLLEDPKRREQLREQGHETFLQHHTPKHRAEKMIKTLIEFP